MARPPELVRRINAPRRLLVASYCLALAWIGWLAMMAAVVGLAFDAPSNAFGTLFLVSGIGMSVLVLSSLLLGSSSKCPWCRKALMFADGNRGALAIVQNVLRGRNVSCGSCGRSCALDGQPGT